MKTIENTEDKIVTEHEFPLTECATIRIVAERTSDDPPEGHATIVIQEECFSVVIPVHRFDLILLKSMIAAALPYLPQQ